MSASGGFRPRVSRLVVQLWRLIRNMSNDTESVITAIRATLSAARLETYTKATPTETDALALYVWNATVSGALLMPLHVCEVVVRNTVSDALTAVYGEAWPWSKTFELSLPVSPKGYSPRADLQSARHRATTTGKVIPELKFVFWQKLFTSRYEERIWNAHLARVMPNLPTHSTASAWRNFIYKDLEQLRALRNRIAHHEPIFIRDLASDYRALTRLIRYRCTVTASWLESNQQALTVIQNKPK